MIDFKPQHKFFVGIDSDGCAFDTMEVKHKECFIPNTIQYYHLQPISKFAREAAEFVNLYSKSRGINRFPALVETLDWLRKRPEVQARGVKLPDAAGLVAWIKRESKQANAALEKAVNESGDADLKQALAWSKAVNDTVERLVHGVPPFPLVKESLAKLEGQADMLVVSATPGDALKREWEEHGIARYVAQICGQEVGTKKEILTVSKQYAPGQTLMIGDAPGDYSAAKANGTWFFPINPGEEDASWQRFHDEGIERFLSGKFNDAYQRELLDAFEKRLPATPPWPVV